MSFGLGRGRTLETGAIGVDIDDLPPLPDDLSSPENARIDPRAWFEHPAAPIEIDIGCGKGAFLVEQAPIRPGANFLGIEQAGEFYRYTADRCRRRGLENVRVLRADAVEFLRWRVPCASVRTLHLYFSDPWPKKRHHKRRVVQDPFLAAAGRVLEPGGELRIVTDHAGYWAWIEEHAARWTAPERQGVVLSLKPFGGASATRGELVGTNFERKYAREGRAFHALTLIKKTLGSS